MSAATVFRTIVAATLCTALAACTMGPDFVRPQAELSGHWQGEAVAGNAIDRDAAWWAGFDDPLLGQLANQVLAANLDLQLAANRVQQSRAARGITAADRLPSVSASASGVRARNSEVGLNDPSGNGGRDDYGLFQTGIGLSWELDLWGRVRRQVEAADARVQMAEEDAHAVRTALLAETARDYLQLRATRQLLAITEDNLSIAHDIKRLTEARQRQGVASTLQVSSAAAQVASLQARIAPLRHRESQLRNALAFLLAQRRRRWTRSCRMHAVTGRRCRRWRWACPANWPSVARISVVPKRHCMWQQPASAWPRPVSCRASP